MLSLILYFLVFIISSFGCRQYEVLDDQVYSADRRHFFGVRACFFSVDFKKIFWFLVILIPPVFISAFRGLDVGTDNANYLSIYQYNKTYNLFDYLKIQGTYAHDYEAGYQQLLHLAYFLKGGYNLAKALSAFLIIVFVWRGALYYHRKFEINSGLCMFFFYLLEFTYGLNGVRYAIALSIFFYAFQFVIERKILKYSVCCFVMVMFHSSMILAALFYLINFTGYKALKHILRYIIAAVIIIVVIFLRPIINLLLPLAARYSVRLGRYAIDTTAAYGVGLYFVFALFLLPLLRWGWLVRKKVEWQAVLIAVLTYIPLRFLGYFSQWLIRLSRMPEILFCVVYCGVINKKFPKSENCFWCAYLFILLIGYYIIDIVVQNSGDSYPFIFDFTNII